jgi:hypothetical protein
VAEHVEFRPDFKKEEEKELDAAESDAAPALAAAEEALAPVEEYPVTPVF